MAERWNELRAHPERGTVTKEALTALGVFFGIGIAVIVPFLFLYGDQMPRAEDGRSLGARRAMGEDPVVFVVIVAGAILAGVGSEIAFRRIRPRLVRKETARDVTDAARVAARELAAHHVSDWQAPAAPAATSYLLGLRKRHWPYEADRIWVYRHGTEIEVIAERSFQKAALIWSWGSSHRVARVDVQARARASVDGTVTSQLAVVFEPSPPHSGAEPRHDTGGAG
ncbi:hypothetical protein [Phytoactinopolyspora endophytica]|uniref:hypothetical protein n=1 Tax=Phytoactinopolyspora endophytica TaxID=1642495 RepID=UPI00101DDAA3|nr:hypothetical protein [Phytoactinopolyspora endophytica]